MKKFLLTLSFAAFTLAAATGDPAKDQAASFVDLGKAERFGARYADNALHFTAGEKLAAPARLPKKYDFTNGVRFDFEFRDNGKQFNPYPRLIQAGGISIHLVGEADDERKIKITVAEDRGPRYGIIVDKIGFRPGAWRKISVYLDAKNRCFGLLVDGKITSAKALSFAPGALRGVTVYLGAADAKKEGVRGFSGSLRNLHIVTPFQAGNLAPDKVIAVPAIRGKKLEHFTICALKGRHLAFPGVTRLPDGMLAVVFREGEGHVCPYGRVCIVYSRDGGKNWSSPIVIRDTVMDERDPAILTLSDGRVLVTHGGWFAWLFDEYTRQKYARETAFVNQLGYKNIAKKVSGTNYIFSHDGGKTFTETVPVGVFCPHGPVFYKGKFYCASIANERGKRQLYMNVGSGDAKSWRRYLIGECEKGNGRPAYEEPHTAVLPDGTLLTAIRVPQDGYLRTTRSTDGGQTWSKIEKTPVRGYPYHLLVLSDGRLLATYGYRYFPEGVRACLSTDGGRTWDLKHEIVLQNNGTDVDLGYPVSIEMDDKRILTVYYHSDKHHDNCFIEGVFWKP